MADFRPASMLKWLLLDHILGMLKDLNVSLKLKWKALYHFSGRHGSFSFTYLQNVVDFLSAISNELICRDVVLYNTPLRHDRG